MEAVRYADPPSRWDDWVPQDRLRKFNDDNKELANHLKKEMDAMRQRSQKSTSSHKKKTTGSARDSEERNSSIAPRGQKRARDFEIEKVSIRKPQKNSSLFPLPNETY